MEQNFFGGGSFGIFIISLMAYILVFFTHVSIPNTLSIILLWLFPLVGIIFGFLKKGVIQISGLIFFLTVVVPCIVSFFWKEPRFSINRFCRKCSHTYLFLVFMFFL